jgi:MmyB-like transcription regulator ligand binding domain
VICQTLLNASGKIPVLAHVGQEVRLNRVPAEGLSRDRAGRGGVQTHKARQPTEMHNRLVRGNASHRNSQPLADCFCDGPHWNALFGSAMQARARCSFPQREPEQARRIKPMHRRPAVGTVADIGRKTLAASNFDQRRDKSMVACAVTRVLTDYEALAPDCRNMLRLLFCDSDIRASIPDWESNARLVVAVFRADVARAGGSKLAEKLVAELVQPSPGFEVMWRDHDVRTSGEGTKYLQKPAIADIALDYSSFSVDGQPSLNMMVFIPATPADAERVRRVVA